MRETERRQLIEWAGTRPAEWYATHPNADRAFGRIVATMTSLEERLPVEGCPLTIRQLQTVGGLAGGLSYKQIAERLGIKPSSILIHATNTYIKLGLSPSTPRVNAVKAVAIAMRAGWL